MGYKKIDNNQIEIVKALRSIGATVQSIASIGKGCPDLLVGYRYKNYLMEIKDGSNKLTKHEELWQSKWMGCCYNVRTAEEAYLIIGIKEGK